MSTPPAFIHLRLHSEYSIQDSIIRIHDAVSIAAADHMPALALTDLSNLFGLVKFYQSAIDSGVKPIIGCDVWITNETDRDKPIRLLLLCQSYTGYLLLCRLLSRAYRENQYRGRVEIKTAWLHQEENGTAGLIALSGARMGEIGQLLLQNNQAQAELQTKRWAKLFPDCFYIEIQREGHPNEEILVQHSLILASKLNLPVVATQSIQFINQDDYKAHEARVCIAEGYVLGDRRRPKNFTEQQYFKTQTEMVALFADIPAALANSIEIAKRCNLSLELGINQLPLFPTPNHESLEDYLHNQALVGLNKRMAVRFPVIAEYHAQQLKYRQRLDFEVDTIIQMGFAGYFLIVADFINWAKTNDVPVGPGRGSGAGSLVAYSLGITDLDPLRYDLLFERFLNPERVSMPDFDIDFCQDRRECVIEYVKHQYGTESVSQIVTFGTMAAKAVIRDVGRVLDLPYNFVDQLAKLIPFELGMTLKRARDIEPQLDQRARDEEDVRNLLELAERLEGLTRNVGMHAGGVLIAPGKITDFCPIYCTESGTSVVSQLDKDDVEKIGLVKFDFLGLKTLTTIDRAVQYIRQQVPTIQENNAANKSRSEEIFSLEELPLDDNATYTLLRQGNGIGIFQFESRGMKDLLQKAKPDCFEDIIALVALYRPGPMDLIPEFIERKLGKRINYPDPRLQPILSPTYGIMIYQEQVMQIAQVIGGYSLGSADLLRRAMGKKKVEEMAQQREIFVSGAVNNGLTQDKAAELFSLMEKFAGYGFNKSHAAAYALIAYQTAYLKTHYPAEFMAATLSADMDDTDKVHIFLKDSISNNLTVLPPDINLSGYHFVPVNKNTIRYGLGAVKGTGETAISTIVDERTKNGLFTDLFDFCCRVDKRIANRRVMESLVRVGAFDSLNNNRASLLASVGAAIESAEQISQAASQGSLFNESDDATVKPQLIKKAPWSERDRLQNEKLGLGFYLSGHPYNTYVPDLKHFIKTRLDRLTPQREPQLLAGIIYSVRIQMTRRGRMAIIVLDDGCAQVELVIFDELFVTNRDWLKEDQLLIVEAKVQTRGNIQENSGEIRVTAEKLYDFANARSRYAKQIKLYGDQLSLSNITKLKELLTPYCHHGETSSANGSNNNNDYYCRISLVYHNSNAVCELDLGNDWEVSLHDNLLQSLTSHFKADNIKIIY
ncbi:MAG: DNA polymerase III subunit alpha [Nitrosomonas sp.]|nr:DNA polymerase III subunit alpha [Nitrosomonas sp.]MDP1949516.1 DNA polymerase III subunit alpha [Nitrosomonas sp.]